MRIDPCLLWRYRRLMLGALIVTCVAVWSVSMPVAPAEAGSIVIPGLGI